MGIATILGTIGRSTFHADRRARTTIAAITLLASVALLLTAPARGDFMWGDAPRHALNGVFLRDLFTAMPLHAPREWAVNYYLQYPALTILFYPPLFYVVEAALFAVFGVSNQVAQIAVMPFTLLLAASAYRLARFAFPRWSALGVALVCIGAPEAALWGRQVMLDVPCVALVAASCLMMTRYLCKGRTAGLYWAVALLVAACYTKYNAVFFIPVLAVACVVVRGPAALRDRHIWLSAILGIVALAPAIVLLRSFGQVNIASVAGRGVDLPISDPHAWFVYARLLPHSIGWLGLALALAGLALAATRQTRLPRPLTVLAAAWLIIGYVFFSAIGLREDRTMIALLVPLALLAMAAIHRLLPPRLTQPAGLAFGAGTFTLGLGWAAPLDATGYREIAAYVSANTGSDAVVLYSGYRDGNFVFDIRERDPSRRITVIRADKLLLDITVERERGVGVKELSEAQIGKMLSEYGVTMVVQQAGFWTEYEVMRRLDRLLHSSLYRLVHQQELSNYRSINDGKKLEVFVPQATPSGPRQTPAINVGIIGQSLSAPAPAK